MNGIEHIADAFRRFKAEGRAAFMPYFTLGYPTPELSVEIVCALAQAGAGLIELGIPYSDPLADGPTIQHSTQVALEQGVTVRKCLDMVRQLRERGVQQPLILMGYYNPILAFGLERFIQAARKAGADGLIVPDLPLEEAGALEAISREAGVALIYLAAPTSPVERLKQLAARTRGFLYLVSLTGVTGARQELPESLENFVERARAVARTPLAVGFGVSTPEQVKQVGGLVDGVIVGSALIHAAGEAQGAVKRVESSILALLQAC
jgi:tryptophan synthase alpha chain